MVLLAIKVEYWEIVKFPVTVVYWAETEQKVLMYWNFSIHFFRSSEGAFFEVTASWDRVVNDVLFTSFTTLSQR